MRKMMKKITGQQIFVFLLLLLTFLSVPKISFSADAAGAQTFQFLRISPGARAVAMGGAYAGLAADATAIHYNPAGLGFLKKHEAFLEFNNSFQGVDNYYLAGVAALAPRHTLGVAVFGLQVGGLTRTQVNVATGNPVTGLGNFDANDVGVKISYAYKVTEEISLAGTGGVATSKIDNVSATGEVFDLGVLWRARRSSSFNGLSLGASVLNLGSSVTFQAAKEDLPLTTKIGMAYGYDFFGGRDRGNFVLDFDIPRSQNLKVRLGGEYWVMNMIAGRVGFLGNNDAGSGVTVGAGFRYRELEFDWSFVPFGDLGNQHHFSLKVQFGASREKVKSKKKKSNFIYKNLQSSREVKHAPSRYSSQSLPESHGQAFHSLAYFQTRLQKAFGKNLTSSNAVFSSKNSEVN